ncbi:MAG: hypothetical protein PHW66_06455 [Gallionella sp.]|nr:hypothetical protein [Gallionella sp.]
MPDVFDQILDAEQKPAAAQKDVFDVALDQMQSEEEQRLRSTLDAAGKANPDQAAEAQRLSGQTGMPADMVERNLDEVRRQARVQSMNLRDMMATSPVLSRQLTDLNFAKLAFDDHENLSGIEKGFRFLKNTGDALAAVVPRFAEQSYGLGQAVGDFLPSQLGGDAVANYFAGHRKHAKEVADYWMPNGDGVLERSWYSGMHSLGLNILNLPLAYGTGGMGRILTAMGAETGGQSYGQARDAGLNQYESLLFGSSQGVIEAGTEMIGMPALFGMLKPGQFATKAAEYMVKEQGGEQIATHLQDMNEWAMLHPEKSIGDYLSERPNAILETALSTAFAGGGQVAVMKGVEMVVNRGYKASAAEQRITALEQVQNLMAASKVLQRSPESMGSYVEQLAAETGAENVYLQSNVLSDPALAQELYQMSPAIAAQFKTAAAIGGEIRIPIAEYLTRIAPTHGTQLIDDIRIEGEQFTRREAVDFMQSQSEALQQEVERALGEQTGHAEFRASQEAVKQRILAELNNMNRFTEQKNELDATLIAARSAVRAAQLGMTPEQFFEKQLLRVQAEGMQGEQFDQAMMLEKATSAWQSSLKGATKGKEYYVPVVHTPSILREFGYKARMVDLPSRVLEAINEKHPDIPEDVIQNLPKYIHAPRYVFKHKSGGLRMILNATTEKGEPIAVGIEDGRIRTITPIHDENGITGNDRVLGMVGDALTERGGKVYAENKEALEESRASLRILSGGSVLGSEGPQLPNPVSRHAATVFGMDNLVNKYGEGFYQNGIRLSRSSIGATHNGMNIRDLRALVSRIEKSYKNMPDVVTLESPEALDLSDAEQKRLYDYIASNDALKDVEGATHEGKIYLFASGMPDEFRAEFVLAQHEITHVGLRAVYGTEADAVLQTIWMNNPSVRAMAAEVKQDRGITSNIEATEEVLADMPTDDLVKLKGWRKLVQMVRNWFEKHGFTTTAKRLDALLKAGMTERQQADLLVADVVAAAREWVKSGKSGQMGTIHDTRLSRQAADRDLIAQHNLSAENLLHAHRMGGIAVPSLAITKKQNPLTNFGEITLMGSEAMADPKGYASTKVFGADIYSPRYPQISYSLDKTALKNLNEALAPYRKEGQREIYGSEIGSIDDLQQRDEFNKYVLDKTGKADFFDLNYRQIRKEAEKLMREVGASERIFQGFTNSGNRRYIDHTLENVVKILKKELRGGEGNNYGVGSIRSQYTPQFKSIAQIRKEKGRLMDKASFEQVKEEVDNDFWKIVESLGQFSSRGSEFGFGDTVSSIMYDAVKQGIPRALKEYGIEGVTPEAMQEMADFMNKLRTLPTEYFEAKILRDVDLSEFSGAVVPEGTSQEVIDALHERGVTDIRYYDKNNEADRANKIREFEHLFFQQNEVRRGAFSPTTNTISLLKNADLSTFLHEGAHYFFENDIALAMELTAQANNGQALTEGEQQIVDDVSRLMAWNGIQGDIQDQLRQWGGMSFEERRAYHERVAESFESYLLEGKAPSIELQSAFQSFRAWLLNVYRSLKEFLNSHPEAGKLNDEVRQVFDRMLATTEQIKLAEQSRSLMPLFGTPEQAGMTVEEFARYQAMGTAATQAAIEELQAKGLRDMKWLQNARNKKLKVLQREADDKRRQVRSTVRAEVMSQPVYRAWQFLTNKIGKSDKIDPMLPRKSDPNVLDETQDSLFVAIAKLGGIDKAQVIATWGTDAADKPSSHLFGKPVWRVENGLTIDGMAEALGQYGYLELDENGKPDVRELEEKWAAELSGDAQYSNAYQPDAFDQMRPGEQVPNLAAILSGRLDAHALREMSITDDQIKILQARGMVADEGLHPDVVADLPSIQIGSGDQMVHMLLEANEPKAEIERLTDERMLQMYGELASPEAIQKAADQAVHNDLRGKMLATEANILAKATGQRKILSDAARQFAADMIARLRVRDVKPAQYVNAEVRAAKAAEAATDMNVKAGEKRNQVIQHYAARAAYDALDEVEKGVRYLSKFGKDGTRKKISADYLNQIDAMLERFDLRKGQSLKEIDRRTTLAQWIAAQEEAGAEPDIPDWLQLESNKTHYKNLTMEEFRGLVDAIKQIEHLGRFKERLINARDQRALNDIVEELTQQIEESSGGRIVDNEIRNELTSKAKALGKGFMAIHRKMANMIYEMDGFKYGPLWEHLIRTMNEAGDREASMRAEATIKLTELAKPILKGERMGGKGKFFPSLGRSLNRGERLAIALNWGNEGNRQRLMDGRNWSIYNLQPVLDSLTAEEWKFVQDVWDFFEGYRPEIGAKERRIYGKEPNWVEPTPFTIRTTDGQELNLRGGYYPIKYDVRQSGKAGEKAAQEEAATMMRAAHTAATTRRSFVKTRSAEIKGRPLLLSMDGIWQGANEVIHDLAFHEWLIDSSKLLKRLDPAIREHYGAEYMNEIKAAILDTARGEEGAKNTWERIVNHVRTGTTVAGLGWNLTTALLQPLGISNSIVRVGAGWMAKGMWQFYGNPVEMVAKAQQIQDKSEFMRNRARTMQREINEIQNQIMAAKSKAQQTLESSFFIMIQKLQAWVDYPTWLGEYEKAIAENHDEATAIAMADQAVIDSQGGGQTKDLARIQRGGPLQKLWTNFYSFFSVTLNLAVDKTKATDFKNPAQVAALAGDYVLLMVFPAIMGALMKSLLKGGDDDDDELAKQLIAEQISFLMGQFIGVRELTAAVQAATGVGIPGIGYSGPAGARLFSEMQRLGQQINQGEVDEAFLKAANNVAGILFHYPAGQVARTVQGAQALIDGETTNPLAPVVGPPRK